MTSACGNTGSKNVGEMDADELWETTMDPERRTLYRVTAQDAEAADKMVELCMGKKVRPRKELILDEVFAA